MANSSSHYTEIKVTNRFILEKRKKAPFYRCVEIGAKHGFATRLGGVSTIPYLASLNTGYGLGDEDGTVDQNRLIFSEAVGFDVEKAVGARQIHSSVVKTVTSSDAGRFDFECDGFVTGERGIALTVKTADCVPILFCDEDAGVIGAVHAGWRGTAAHIAPICISEMEKLGARAENVKVAVGACIHSCCYEVDQPFFDSVEASVGKELCSRFVLKDKAGDRYHADLAGLNCALLEDAGVLRRNIFVCSECTCCKPEVFFSHRASGGKRGVMMSAIVL